MSSLAIESPRTAHVHVNLVLNGQLEEIVV